MNTTESGFMLSAADRSRTGIAAVVASATIWYDFLIFGVIGALVFNDVLFPTMSQDRGRMVLFTFVMVGFLTRPLGAAFFGRLGDTLGRRNGLKWSLFLAGLSTAIIGVIPAYSLIGLWAPGIVLLLRLCGGFALGGVWAGAVVLATENGSGSKPSMLAATPQFGAPLGVLGAVLTVALFVVLVSNQAVQHWVWRIPFILTLPVAWIAVYLCLRAPESPVFYDHRKTTASEAIEASKMPVAIAMGSVTSLFASGLFYSLTIFNIHYSVTSLDIAPAIYLAGAAVAAILGLIGVFIGARLMQSMPAWGVVLLGMALSASFCLVILMTYLFASKYWAVMLLGAEVGSLGIAYAALGKAVCEMMPVASRYRGVAVAYNSAAVIGGLLPFTIISQRGGAEFTALTGFSWLLWFMCGISAIGALWIGYKHSGAFTQPVGQL